MTATIKIRLYKRKLEYETAQLDYKNFHIENKRVHENESGLLFIGPRVNAEPSHVDVVTTITPYSISRKRQR